MTQATINLLRLFSLRSGQATAEEIDATIRDNARLGGTNIWVLMFAIVIASVGLNVNSTAVIIGAMLISPLMGPIIGIGFGAAVHDYGLIREAFRNLVVFVAISLLASSLYFLLSPLKAAHAELLARTAPTIWDVLIAFFGGAAGAIGLTRKEKTTLIPGVAIATALMPPLCTAGYGIASGQPQFFFGAFYLFLINGVFIAIATLVIVRILRLPQHAVPDEATRRKGRAVIAAAVILTLFPSAYLAVRLVQDEIFTAAAGRFLAGVGNERSDVVLLSRQIDPAKRQITATVIGLGATPELEQSLNQRLAAAGLHEATLRLRRPAEAAREAGAAKAQPAGDALHESLLANEAKATRIRELETRLDKINATGAGMARVESEIRAQLPGLRRLAVTGTSHKAADGSLRLYVLVAIDDPKGLPRGEAERLKRWLKIRLPEADVDLIVGRMAG